MTGRVMIADVEFIKSLDLSELLLEQVLAEFAERHELGWSMRVIGSIVVVSLVAPYRMGETNLKILFLELLLKIGTMNTSSMHRQKVGV